MNEARKIVRAAKDYDRLGHRLPSLTRWERLQVAFWVAYGNRVEARERRRQKALAVSGAPDRLRAFWELKRLRDEEAGPGPRAQRRAVLRDAETPPTRREARRAARREALLVAQAEVDQRAREVAGRGDD